MLQSAGNPPSSFLAARGHGVRISGFEESFVAVDGAGSRAPGVSAFSVCSLDIHGVLRGELEKRTKKSSCLVGTNLLGRALHLPWEKNGALES